MMFVSVMVKNLKSCVQNCYIDMFVACYTVRSVKPFVSQETLKMVYYARFNSFMNHGENTSRNTNIFKIQKNIISIITGCKRKDLCRFLFKNLKTLPFSHNIYYHFFYLWVMTKINLK